MNLKVQVDTYRKNIVPKKLLRIDNNMKSSGVQGVGLVGDSTGSSDAVDVAPVKNSIFDKCTIM